MDAIGVVLVLLVLFGVAMLSMAVVGTVKAVKTVAAKVERHEATARRTVENVALKARTFTKPGVQGQIPAVRLSLRSALDSTRQVLESGLPQDGQLTEALQLLTRLDAHASVLDGELRMLEREPGTERISAKLPELRERAERITHSAESLRWAAQDRMRRFADDELARLSEECVHEAGALRHWDPADTALPSEPVVDAAPDELTYRRRPSAEEVLGLAEPLARLADRLRKPNPGGSAAGRPHAG